MGEFWKIDTHGNPFRSIQSFLRAIWTQVNLDLMLVSVNGEEEFIGKAYIVEDPKELSHINPFKPLMTENAARFIPELVRNHPLEKLAALLRPCEMCALIEMVKHNGFKIDNLITICVDCLGTFPEDEYCWRVERKVSPEQLTKEALHFAPQGGILTYRYRSVCQMCAHQGSAYADINIHVLGLPVRQLILIEARNDGIAKELELAKITHGIAPEDTIRQHKITLARLSESHHHTISRIVKSLNDVLPKDIDALIKQFESCGGCSACMAACPICSINPPRQDSKGQFTNDSIARWLVSCVGCGMCEQSCINHLPLGAIFNQIRERLDVQSGFLPGHSLDEPLPQ